VSDNLLRVDVDVLDADVAKIAAFFANLPEKVLPALMRAADEGGQVLVALAQKERFRGKGPYPVSKRKLGVVTGRLRKALWASEPRMDGPAAIVQRLGANVSYFGVHEFGYSGRVQVRGHTRRLAQGKATKRKVTGGEMPTFAFVHGRSERTKALKSRLQAKRKTYAQVRPHSRRMDVKARAPLGATIDEHSERVYSETFKEALAQVLEEVDV